MDSVAAAGAAVSEDSVGLAVSAALARRWRTECTAIRCSRCNAQSAITSASVNADADDRTNTLVVTGPKDVLETVAKVIKELEDNPEAEDVRSRRASLKNADAVDVESTLNSLISGSPSSHSSTGQTVGRTSLSSGSSLGWIFEFRRSLAAAAAAARAAATTVAPG